MNRLKWVSTIGASLCVLVSSLFSLQAQSIDLATLPQKDRERLSLFFEQLLINAPFAYTLFGDKPVSFEAYFTNQFSHLPTLQKTAILTMGEKTWKKYEHHFQSKKFILSCTEKNGVHCIYLINVQAFLAKVNEHLDLFQEVFGSDMTAALLLEKITKEDMLEVLHPHDELIGILLGFGRYNSMLFHRMREAFPYCCPLPPFQEPENQSSPLSLEERFCIKKNINYMRALKEKEIYKKMQKEREECIKIQEELLVSYDLYQSRPLSLFSLPVFRASKRDQETMSLIRKYEELQTRLMEIYSSGNFLEITLSQFMGEKL